MNARCFAMLLAALLGIFALATNASADDSAAIKAIFADPPREYASAPLWVWNDMLTEEQIRSTMQDLAGQKVMQVFVHPRPGLMTPYLEKDWFRLWKVALDEAEKLDMNVWMYDENSYPSGFAGGLVPEAMPESRGKGVHFSETTTVEKPGDDVLAVYRLTYDGFENVTEKARSGEALPEDRYLLATIRLAPVGGWFGGKYYVDLLKPGVTEKFIEITLGPYERELGEHFGKRLPGWFTDEPHLQPAGGLHWSDGMAERFQKRWNYDLIDRLPSLVRPLGDWRRVRHNYQQFLLEQFIEHWSKPCYEYCEKHNLEFTGHYWEHGWPGAGHGPDNMAMYAWHQRPAIDNLMNQYGDGTGAQFGNSRTVKELATVANQMGRKRTLCEAYGAGGWDLRFEDMKRIGDWLYVLGVNTLNEHLSYITIRGARKRDHPQSFSYHEPWWDSYHVMAQYFTRLSAALSSGEQVNRILLIQPTTTGWMYQPDGSTAAKLREVGNAFQDMVNRLEQAQAEYDVGCEDIMGRHGSVDGNLLVVGQRKYDLVVLTPHTENLNSPTMALLETFAKAGGNVLCCGTPPTILDGSPSDRGKAAAENAAWQQVTVDEAIAAMQRRTYQDGLAIVRSKGDRGLLFHHRRRVDDGEILFLVNTSIENASAGMIGAAARGIERWDPATGKVSAYPFTSSADAVRAEFQLPRCGSLLLFLSKGPIEPAKVASVKTAAIQGDGPPKVRRLGPNVLTLDYVDITAGGETKKNVYFYQANRFAFQQNGMQRNPWDSAVQLHDNLISKTFPADSGFEATYRFTIEDRVPEPLHIVIERPDLYSITCNGTTVAAEEGSWWLDKAFGKIEITAAAKVGENAVAIKARPMTIYHELESAYVLGDFSLKATESGFAITRPKPLGLGARDAHSTEPEGSMWLSAGIGIGFESNTINDGDPFIVFDLSKPRDLTAIKVWNYNEIRLTGRGVKQMKVLGSPTGEEGSFTTIGTFMLDRAESGSTGPSSNPYFPRTFRVRAKGVRFVKFDILSNHTGAVYPTDEAGEDNALVGLSEVQFFGKSGGSKSARIPEVAVGRVSSEIGGQFNRRAKHLVDGSGLRRTGWNTQGHPFYAQGVAYTETFNVPQPSGKYLVSLPAWKGAVARVRVNGEEAGHIAWQPWQSDVTEQIRPGRNTIEVTVIGTLRNTLGPHHIGPVTGTAWPSMFHNGPQPGPPSGDKYSTLGYGLFEPFVLKQEGR